MAIGMKCGICGKTERIMFETNHSYYGKDSQRRDSKGEPIPYLNEDGSVRMREMNDAADLTEHKRFEHPVEYAALAQKRKDTKETNARQKEIRGNNMRQVGMAGQEAVAVPVLEYDDYWQHRTDRFTFRKDSAYTLNTSRTDDYGADRARTAVREGWGDKAAGFNSGHNFRQITDADVAELTALDEQIKELKESRNVIAVQMYERGAELTNQHLADLGDARSAAEEAFERMVREGDELEGLSADDGKLTDSDVEVIVEAAMGAFPGKFIFYSKEEMADALSAYGYPASAEVVRNGGHRSHY